MSHVVKVQAAHAAGGFILAAWLPQGIAEAMEPIRQGVSVLAHLHKRITLSPDNFKDEPLSIEDIELLKHIWADIPSAWPLAVFQIPRIGESHLWENFMRDDYARFGEAFATSAHKPDWDVVPAFFDPVETGNSKRLEIRSAHWAELEKAAVDGRIKLFDDIGIPVTKMEIGTKISVVDARKYLASVPPGFVLEIIEPATRDQPILRHADEVSVVNLPPYQWLLTDDVALAIAKAVHPLPLEADGHFETRLKHVLRDGRNQFVRSIKYVNPKYEGTYQGEAYLRHAAQLVAEVRSGSIAAISQSRTPVTEDVPGMMLKRADVLRYLERCGIQTAEANTLRAVEEADASPDEAPRHSSSQMGAVLAPPETDTSIPTSPSDRPLRMGNSTKGRRENDLTKVIQQAQAMCSDPFNTAEVWAALLTIAKSDGRPHVLLGTTSKGVKHLVPGGYEILSKKNVADRLGRARKKSNELGSAR